VRDGLGKHGLTSTGGTIKENTLRRRHTILDELLWVVDGVLHCLLQFLLDLLQATNVVPGDGRHFDDGLAKSRWVGGAEGESHVLHRDTEGVQHLCVNSVFVQIDQVHLFTDLLHGSF
jgi:hypothetical protein